MQFKDVLGLEKTKKHLIESYQADRTAHAQIFSGKEGCGGLPLALAYAQYLLCEDQQAEDACGTCNPCRKVAKMIHPDLHFSYPTVGPKVISTDFIKEWREAVLENPYLSLNDWLEKINAENRQGNINKDECNSIIQRLSLKANEGRFKIMILWLPEFLGYEGNKLLKSIEEPRPNTVFLLISENSEKILNTILSRCQMVNIPLLSDEEIATALEQHYNASPEKAQTVAYLAEGNFTKAIQLLNEVDNNNALIFVDWLRVCYQGKPKDMVQWVEAIVSGKHPNKDFFQKMGRKDQIIFLQYALFFLKEFLALHIGGGEIKVRLQNQELATAQNMLKVIGIEQLQGLIKLYDEMAYHIERNGNPRILFLDASIQMHHILRKQKLPVV